MADSYLNFIQQNYNFPQKAFGFKNENLTFHNIPLKQLIDKHGTPFRLTYLPKIGEQIEAARAYFNDAIKALDYKGKYHYCYCTKCNHFYPVVSQALKQGAHIETSSPFDIDLIVSLLDKGEINKERTIIHNGYKTTAYLKQIIKLQKIGFHNAIVVLDNEQELSNLLALKPSQKIKIGIRMAITQAPNSAFHTSRLGIAPTNILPFFRKEIQDNPAVELKMLHFFVDNGIKDNDYYWGEFDKALDLFLALKSEENNLDSFNIGGGFPIPNHLAFKYDYSVIVFNILNRIKNSCAVKKVAEPNIYTEFGKYTVGESSAIIFAVLETKQQNKNETWFIIDNSLLNTIPDAWALQEKFILLPINKWANQYGQVNIGGISCDHTDYYNSEDMNQEVILPYPKSSDSEPLYLGFFHTGAYQDAISGYGGIKHCLIPSPKHIIIDHDDNGNLVEYVFREESNTNDVFDILGY